MRTWWHQPARKLQRFLMRRRWCVAFVALMHLRSSQLVGLEYGADIIYAWCRFMREININLDEVAANKSVIIAPGNKMHLFSSFECSDACAVRSFFRKQRMKSWRRERKGRGGGEWELVLFAAFKAKVCSIEKGKWFICRIFSTWLHIFKQGLRSKRSFARSQYKMGSKYSAHLNEHT